MPVPAVKIQAFSYRYTQIGSIAEHMVAMEGMETSGTAGLIGVSSIMLFGAYIAGLLPAVMKLSNPKHLQLVSRSHWS